jgi:hypothetical protein
VGEDRTGEPQLTNRLTFGQAAAHLGISEGAVRNRIKRGTLRAEREAGRVYVLVAGAASRDESPGESPLVAVLREQLAAERQAHAEVRRLLAATLERIPPQLEAPAEPPPDERGSPERAEADEASYTAGPLSVRLLLWSVVSVSIGFGLVIAGGSIYSIISAISGDISGDQWVTLFSAIITALGSVGAAVGGGVIVFILARRGRNQ